MARTESKARREQRIAYLEALCRAVPYHIVEKVLADPTESSVGNQSFEGSVMFADVVGFTSLCEGLSSQGPEGLGKLSHILNEVFTHLLDEAIFPYGGYVVQFGGDSITVVFRGDDQARRAVAAALACLRIMHGELGRLLDGRSGELMLRIGLAAGQIDIPVLGDYTRRTAVCAGLTAHRALVLQQIAQPNEIVADAALVRLIGRDVEVVDRRDDRAVVRGLREWPATVPIAELGDRTRSQVEEKIALLEPLVPQPLTGRMKSTPKGWRIEGELRNVVVLFVEVQGLELGASSVRTSPSSAPVNLNIAIDVARSLLRAYRTYGGIVTKADLAERGHRVMVIFGLHMPANNDAERALLAGLESTARIRGYAAANQVNVSMRTGVHAGRVYFGAIGSDLKHDITVVGDTVNLAARTAAAAEAFEVLVTTPVRNAVAGEFEHSSRGPVRVKGKTSSVSMYVIHGPTEGRAHFVQARQQSRFCAGRVDEIAALNEAVDRGLAGDGQIIGVVGEGGAGKSFILSSVIDRWILGGGVGVLGRCRFATRSAPLTPVVAMFANFLGLTEKDSDEDRRERIRAGLESFKLKGGAPELISLLQPVQRTDGLSEALVDLADLHARERVLASIVEFLIKRVKHEPVLYVIEDLHFADTLTVELTQRLTAVGGRGRFLMIGTYRRDPVLKDLRRGLDTEIELKDLTLADSTALVAHELRAKEVDPDLAVFLWERARGRPGHLVEILRFLGERQLVERRGAVAVAPEPGVRLLDDIVPRTLAQVALARLDDLGALERRLLRMASVVGRRFGKPLLEEVSDTVLEAELDSDWLEEAVTRLASERVIVASAHEQSGYMFRDGVTRAVAYGTIPGDERRELHRRIADALEKLSNDDPRRAPATLALHRERAEQWEEAVDWYQRAARTAMRAGLDREAIDLIDRWEATARHLPPETSPTRRRLARMALLRFVATARGGQPGPTVRLGRKLAAEHWDDLDAAARGEVDFWLGRALVAFGRPKKARERLERVYNSQASSAHRSDAARLIAETHTHSFEPEIANQWLDKAAALTPNDDYRLARIQLVRANIMIATGNIDRARAIYAQIKGDTRRSEQLRLAAMAATNVAYCDMLNGHFDMAVRGFNEALVMDRALRDWSAEAVDLVNLGQTHLWAGRAEEARPLLARAMGLARDLGEELTVAEAHVHLGAAIALTEDPLEGTRLCREGCERVQKAGLRESELAGELHLMRIAITRKEARAARVAMEHCREHEAQLRSLPLFRRTFAELEKQVAEAFGE